MPDKKTFVRTTPTEKEVQWDKSQTLISKTDKFGNIQYTNQAFESVSGYEASELIQQPHSIIRHPDMPRVIFKILWDNLKIKENFHAIIKNMSKSGDYYWVITNFEIRKDENGIIIGYDSYRKAIPEEIISNYIAPLYQRLLKIEQVNGLDVSEKYFKGYLEDRGLTYYEYVANLLKDNQEEITTSISVGEISQDDNDEKSESKGGFLSKFIS